MMKHNITHIVLDIDGTLTDGGIYYDQHGNELKKFSTKDGVGIVAARNAGIKIVVLTGRECAATTRRMTELEVNYLFQNVKDKAACLKEFMERQGVLKEELAYIGDDINDLASMSMAGFVGCPADACQEVQERADYVSSVNGGYGAVRDVIEHILRDLEKWEKTIFTGVGI